MHDLHYKNVAINPNNLENIICDVKKFKNLISELLMLKSLVADLKDLSAIAKSEYKSYSESIALCESSTIDHVNRDCSVYAK